MVKSDLIEQLDRVQQSLNKIEAEYREICAPVRMMQKMRAFPSELKDALDEVRDFKFYPQMTHVPYSFFEQNQWRSYRFQRAAQLGIIAESNQVPPRVIGNKRLGALLARAVGLSVPKAAEPIALAHMVFDEPKVIKPLHSDGGHCVYAINPQPNGAIVNEFTGRVYDSGDSLKEAAYGQMARFGISKDLWLQEEMIVGSGGSPRETLDVKFYTFYGEIGLILQVDRWRGKLYRFFDLDGNIVDTGKYSVVPDMIPAFDRELIDLARKVSLKIPWPHVRIDFLVSDVDIRFGEFTCQPGGAGSFNAEWDARLAQEYVHAQARLYSDLLGGKQFVEYKELLEYLSMSGFGHGV